MAKVELKKIGKIYEGGVRAAKDITLVIEDEEFVVLVGPSGCGKSTILRMIAGLEEISEGELYIDGTLVNDIPPKDRNIAMVFQNYALYPHMTVFQNMAFSLKIRKISKKEIQNRVHQVAKVLGLEELLDRKPKALSGGQRQRVAVGRAIVRNPKVFLFDEPLSNLDAKLRVQMRAEISKLHKRLKATVVYVTHDQVEAMTMGDKIVVMKDALIQQIGSPLDLYNHPNNKFVAEFIGSPPMNFLEVKIIRKNNTLFLDEGSFQLQLTAKQKKKLKDYINKKVYFATRPENIFLALKTKTNKKNIFETTIDIKELLGAETHLYVKTSTQELTVRIFENVVESSGEKIMLQVDMEKSQFFDLQTEQSIV